MGHCKIGLVFAAVISASAAWAAENSSAPTEQGLPQFLQAADAAAKDGDREGAIQLYHSAIIYAPGDPEPYEKLAEFYVQRGQSELAQQFFALALDVQPAYPPALRGIALLDLAAGNRAGALVQHEILRRACGATCPETAQVEKALNSSPAR